MAAGAQSYIVSPRYDGLFFTGSFALPLLLWLAFSFGWLTGVGVYLVFQLAFNLAKSFGYLAVSLGYGGVLLLPRVLMRSEPLAELPIAAVFAFHLLHRRPAVALPRLPRTGPLVAPEGSHSVGGRQGVTACSGLNTVTVECRACRAAKGVF